MASKFEIIALPEELLAWTAEGIRSLGLHGAGTWLFPRLSRPVTPEDLALAKARPPEWIVLDDAPIADAEREPVKLYTQSRRGVIVQLGRYTGGGLRVSQVSAMQHGRSSGWARHFVDEIKKKSAAGVWAVSPTTGASAFFKAVHFTAGAKAHAATGGALLAFAGDTHFVLDRPASH